MSAAPSAPKRLRKIHDALARVTSSQQFIPQIDGLRFVAISSVFMYHIMEYFISKSPPPLLDMRHDSWLGVVLSRGWFGVDLFFAISGFVISLPFASHHLENRAAVGLRSYYLRRLTRLEPPFVICVTACFLLFVVTQSQNFRDLFPHYLAAVTYSHNIVYHEFSTINPVTWSLEVEIQFYLVAPLLATVFAIKRCGVRRALLIAIVATASALQPLLKVIDTITVLTYMQFFLIGFLLADVYVADWKRAPVTSLSMDAAGLAAALALYWVTGNHDYVSYRPIWIAFSCFALFVGCCASFRGRLLSRILANRWIVTIGGMCYTIYLYHYQIFSLIGRVAVHAQITHIPWINFWITAGLTVPPMLVVSSVLFVLFEKPFMRKDWPNRFVSWLQTLGGKSAIAP